MAFGQEHKKRSNPGGAGSDSTFETDEEKTIKIPDVGGILDQIDNNLNETKDIVVEEQTMERRTGCCCR